MFEKLADFIMKNAKIIVVLWIVALLISVPFLAKYNSVLQYDMNKLGTSTPLESIKGQEILSSGEFNSGAGINGGTIILVEAYDSLAESTADKLKKNLEDNVYFWKHNEDLRTKYGVDCEVTIKQLGRFDDKYFANTDTQMIIYTVNYPTIEQEKTVKNSAYVPDIRNIVSESVAGLDGVVKTYVTGTDAISYDTSTGSTNDIKHIDPISILLVLILIGLFFRSFVTAGTPPVIIGMAYGILLALVYAIGSFMGIYYITTILVLVSMLGAGCDYCIFIISRYREERKEGRSHNDSLRESIIWAGESIITSGISVIIGFGSLMLCSFSLVSTMGMILALGIVLALLAALTFIPSILMIVGDKIFWPSKVSTYKEGSKAMNGWYGKCAALGHRYFTHSAKSAIKYAKVIFAVTILISVPLVYVAMSSNPSYDMISAMPGGEAKDGVAIISENVGGGVLMPTTVSMKVDAFVDLNIGTDLTSGDVIPTGSTVTLTATPITGYMVKGWIIGDDFYQETSGDVTIGADRTDCSIENVTISKTVTVVYGKLFHSVEFETDTANGTIDATSNGRYIASGMDVDYGSKLNFKATPNSGYHVDHWVITRDGESETLYTHDTELLIDQASYDYNVLVHFEADTTATYKVNFNSPEHGKVIVRADDKEITSGSDVPSRSHITISAIPDSGYRVKTITSDDPSFAGDSIPFLTMDTNITVEFEAVTVMEYTVTFLSDGDGTVTATADGKPITSGSLVKEGSKIVFTAKPNGENQIIGWEYDTPLGSVTSYISKAEHTISDLSGDAQIKVIFGQPTTEMVNVSATDGPNGTIFMLKDGTRISDGQVTKGTDLFFTAVVQEGYHITGWTVTKNSIPVTVTSNSNNFSLYDVDVDTEVTFTTELDSFVPLFFGANDPKLGDLDVSSDKSVITYSERSNATRTFAALDGFTQELMAMETDGKKNVALAIGPINGDVLFDGAHEWILDTVWDFLPAQYKTLVGPGAAYDTLTFLWKNSPTMTYDIKQMVNYTLAYKLGFVSEVFTDYEGGPEYQYVKVMVVTKEEPMSALSVDTIKQVYDYRDKFVKESNENGVAVYEAYLSGAAVSNYEMSVMVNKDFSSIIIVVIVLLITLLFLVMNSYLTPVRAVLTIVMSVLWTLGLTYILFDHILGMPVVWIVPIVLFVVCLGLGMDYDILLTTRIKEYVTKGYSNDDAIVAAVQKSGAVITLCGLIMAGAFGTMMLSSSPMLMEFGFALGFAIAVDALIIRTYIVPAIMHLMGDWNWKGPGLGAIKDRFLKKFEQKEEE